MPTEQEWAEAYNHLLQSLRNLQGDGSLILEIQRATTSRVAADLAQEDLDRLSSEQRKVVREELDMAKNRAPTPREAFLAAVDVLVTRLRRPWLNVFDSPRLLLCGLQPWA